MTEDTELQETAKGTSLVPIAEEHSPKELARAFAASGFFGDVHKISQALVKMAAGQELGLGPMASMTGIHLIEGEISLGANLLAALIRRSEHYDYEILELTNQLCVIRFFRDGQPLTPDSEFTIQDAEIAGVHKPRSGWEKYPRNMLFARAISNGFRWHCPELGGGSPLYAPEEFTRVTDGEFVDANVADEEDESVKEDTIAGLKNLKEKMVGEGNGDAELPDDGKKEPGPEPPFDEGEESETRGPTTIETDEPNEEFAESVSERTSELTDDEKGQAIIDAVETGDLVPAGIDIDKPMDLKLVRDFLDQRVKIHKGKRINPDLVKQLVIMMAECLVGVENIDADRHRILLWQWGVTSTDKLRGSELRASLDHLRMKEGRDGRFHPNAVAARELRAIATFMRVGDTKKDNEEAA